ncbi:MAG: hypothetical protein A3I83_10015 [Methylotenera sp. RIFCSPLOWO2_02_FULL_45_14]|nr:MAG: hypothetical protein A3I83_10015 [Methylotenera sp. RIFCSPLOWO2_02_FULL_45_14]
MLEAMRIVRGLSITVMIVTYAVLVHHVNASGQASTLGAVLALMPVFLLIITVAVKTTSRAAGISLLLISGIASWLAWPFIKQYTGFVFWIQDIGLLLVLLMTFGWTLQKDRKPLCVHFAEMINGEALPAEHERYAHKVTVAWVAFFAIMIITSTLLFFMAPLATWSIFVNFLTLPFVALMFMVEFMVRRRVLADLPTGHILDAVRAYLNNSARV